MLEQARSAELLTAEHAAAVDRQARYAEAVTAAAELARLSDSHPSPNPLPVVRQTVERLRALETKTVELRAMLSGEINVDYQVDAATTTWRPIALAAFVIVLLGIGLGVAGQLVDGLAILSAVGIGVAVVGLILGLIAFRARKTAQDFRKQKQMAESEVERRLRGRSQMEAELRQAEEDTAAQLQGLGLPDLAAAEDLLGREEAHVAAIDQLNARLEGLVGRDPVESLAPSRDAAATRGGRHGGPAGRARPGDAGRRRQGAVRSRGQGRGGGRRAGARRRGPGSCPGRRQPGRRRTGRRGIRTARHVARPARRPPATRPGQRGRAGGLERATETTMAKATRYLEKGMTGVVARITDGRYRRVRIDDQTLAISVVAPEKGDWVDIRELSDGTLGQIYLAARLGLIRYATGARRPPLILDDPFVTFDDDHAARGFDILRDLTADHQVIYLTSTDRFDAAAEAVVELPGPTAVDPDGDGAGPTASA